MFIIFFLIEVLFLKFTIDVFCIWACYVVATTSLIGELYILWPRDPYSSSVVAPLLAYR